MDTKSLEWCVMNGDKTTLYFKLERVTRQGDPISVYLFILALEVVFSFSHTFLYSAYAGGTTFFSKKREISN